MNRFGCPLRPRQQGLTLIELVVTIVIVAVASSAVLLVLSDTTRRSADPMLQQQAGAIAQAYLEEILLKPFCDPALSADCPAQCSVANLCSNPACHQPEADRALFNDVCDYHGLVDVGARDQNGLALPGLEAYTVAVEVVDGAGAQLNGLSGAAGQVLLVNVQVSHPSADAVLLSGYRANY